MRLIDADYFKEQIVAAALMHNIDQRKIRAWTGLIDIMPTADGMDKQDRVGTDDVCEWSYIEKYKTSPLETSCGKTHWRQDEISQFNFCPYCGKKIKVVE